MRLINILIITGLFFIITSCKTTEKFSVYAPAGTKIYTPDNPNTPINDVANSEKVKVELPSDIYCGYILAKPADSDLVIPIGIDYKSNSHIGTAAAMYAGSSLAIAGITSLCVGTIMICAEGDSESDTPSDLSSNSDDKDNLLPVYLLGGGAAVAGIGLAIGPPAQNRMRQTAYDYNFGYEKKQKLAIPMLSSTLLNPNPPKNVDKDAPKNN